MKNFQDMTLRDLFLVKLQLLYDMESEIIKALPKLVKAVSNEDLRQALEQHLGQTRDQVGRLEKVFDQLGEKPKKQKSEAIRGLVADAEWLMDTIEDTRALDAALIGAVQAVEHHEMAGYGTAVEWAKLLNGAEAKELLQATLDEEEEANDKLNDIATSEVNEEVQVDTDEMEEGW